MEDVDGIEKNKKEKEIEKEKEGGRGGARARMGSGSRSKGSLDSRESNEMRKAYPVWRRLVRYCFTIPPVIAALAVILIVMSTVFTTQVMYSSVE